MVDSRQRRESAERLADGTAIGEYRIVRLLGEGGMGFVYEANHEVLNRRAAIKFLRPELTTHYNLVERFLQEAKAVNVVNHDNIVDIYDYGERPDGSVYFVMEFLEGEDLSGLFKREGQVGLATTCDIFSQILRALSAAHAKQIVHRDLKPDNVFLVPRQDQPRFVKLLDFGIAKLRGEGAVSGQTVAGTVMGTPQYMSPEQAQGQSVDARSDLYSLGIMLFQAATGRLPFEHELISGLLTKIISEDAPRPRSVALRPDDLSPALEKIIIKAISKDPDQRFQTAEEMLAHLQSLVTPTQAAEPKRLKMARPSGAKRNLTRVFAIGGLLAAAAIAATVVVVRSQSDEAEKKPTETKPGAGSGSTPDPRTSSTPIGAAISAGKIDEAKELARAEVVKALASKDRAEATAGALAEMRAPHLAPFLYQSLDGTPQARLLASRALRNLALPEAAPKIRRALDASGGALRIELAATLLALGDESSVPMLASVLDGKGVERLAAADALLRANKGNEKKVRAVLVEFAATAPGRSRWRRATAALAANGDDKAKASLASELAAPDPDRAVAAGRLLAELGDAKALAYLERVLADQEFELRGVVAVALARAGNKTALSYVSSALAGGDPIEQRAAIAVVALLSKSGGEAHLGALAAATDDKDELVRTMATIAILAF